MQTSSPLNRSGFSKSKDKMSVWECSSGELTANFLKNANKACDMLAISFHKSLQKLSKNVCSHEKLQK